jgi:hypothetical protein
VSVIRHALRAAVEFFAHGTHTDHQDAGFGGLLSRKHNGFSDILRFEHVVECRHVLITSSPKRERRVDATWRDDADFDIVRPQFTVERGGKPDLRVFGRAVDRLVDRFIREAVDPGLR